MLGSDGVGGRTGLLLAAAAVLPPAAAGLPDASWSAVPRRALLQAEDRKSVDTSNQLIVLAGLLSGLILALILISCFCLRGRLWGSAHVSNGGPPADRRARAAAQERKQQLAQQQAKLQQLPFVVIMPDNEVSYAHKLDPETAESAAPPESKSKHPQLELAAAATALAASPAADDPAKSSETDMQATEQPPSVSCPAACSTAAGAAPGGVDSAADAEVARPAAAAVAASPEVEEAAGAAAGSSGWRRLWQHYRERAVQSAANRQAFQQREAVRIRRRAEQLGWAPAAEREVPTEVQPLPAFIEWDVTGTDGPILHPLPPPEAAALPPTSAHDGGHGSGQGSNHGSGSGSGRQLQGGSGRALLLGVRALAETLSAAPYAVLDSPSSHARSSAAHGGGSSGGGGGSGDGGGNGGDRGAQQGS